MNIRGELNRIRELVPRRVDPAGCTGGPLVIVNAPRSYPHGTEPPPPGPLSDDLRCQRCGQHHLVEFVERIVIRMPTGGMVESA